MAGMNLRALRVVFNANRPAIKVSESFMANPVPAGRPMNCGSWRPGGGAPKPIAAMGPETTEYIESPLVLTNPNIMPTRSY